MEIRLDVLKEHIDEKIAETIVDFKKNFVDAMRADITKLQTYKMFPYEETVYVEREDVLKIFDKYISESEDKE